MPDVKPSARASGRADEEARAHGSPGHFDPAVMEPLTAALGPIVRRMWPSSLHGLEHLPAHGRFVIIANHSGMGTAELAALLLAFHTRFGPSRPVASMAHPAAFRVPVLREILRGVGAVEATREGAARARRAGVPLLLFPGGDHEASRPIWKANRVDFAGRLGWVRLAREHGLDIVPLAIRGSHVTLPILAHGRALSWLLGPGWFGAHRAPLPALALVVGPAVYAAARRAGLGRAAALALGWASTVPTQMLPWVPSRIRFDLLAAISSAELAREKSDRSVYDRVVGALQSRVSEKS